MDIHQNVRLQKITVGDAALLNNIAKKAYCDHYLHLWYDKAEWYLNTFFSVENLSQELADPNALFYIIQYRDEIVGFLKLNIDAPFEEDTKDDALELERIYLAKDASGKGIGSFVMNFIFELAVSKNKKIVWLKVMDSSEGPIAFYKKFGFEICGTLQLEFPVMKEEFRGMFIMKKSLYTPI
jgi:ribosomal protein S18 acetylase RimI-like enzyme